MKSDEPKALALLKGKSFLQHILDTIKTLDLPIKPVIVIGHKKERILKVIGKDYNYAHQEKQLGTGHAVASAKNSTHPKHNLVLVLSADQPLVSKETIMHIIEKHLEKKPAITMATALLPDFKEWREGLMQFGRIIRDENNQELKNIVEFKDANKKEKEITEVNPAIYAFDSEWLWKNIDKLKPENAQKEYYLTDLIKIACKQGEKIETMPLENILEALQPNSKEELEILEGLTI